MSRTLHKLLPEKLRRKIYRFGKKLYVETDFPSIESSLEALKMWGFEPQYSIDVGAYHGEWTRMFKRYYPDSHVLMIEAQTSKSDRLQSFANEHNGQVIYENALLGPEDNKSVEFTEMETGSSVFEESSPYDRNKVSRTQVTLDTLVDSHPQFKQPDFLKLDVQGYELEVLKGASELLTNTQIILMEASFIPVNKGAPLIDEVIQFMSVRNYRLLDLCSQIRRKDGSLWQTDLLFIHNNSPLVPAAELDESNWRKVKTKSS